MRHRAVSACSQKVTLLRKEPAIFQAVLHVCVLKLMQQIFIILHVTDFISFSECKELRQGQPLMWPLNQAYGLELKYCSVLAIS